MLGHEIDNELITQILEDEPPPKPAHRIRITKLVGTNRGIRTGYIEPGTVGKVLEMCETGWMVEFGKGMNGVTCFIPFDATFAEVL